MVIPQPVSRVLADAYRERADLAYQSENGKAPSVALAQYHALSAIIKQYEQDMGGNIYKPPQESA